jgi:3-deoxy-manno-octulosonate cytidylyltransferase (CMP-KDO synthetase)
MRIEVARVETVPLGVDTAAQLDRARTLLRPNPQISGDSA